MCGMEQFTGCFVLLFYMKQIFEMSGTRTISPEVAPIIISVIQLLGAYCSTYLVDRVGRNKLRCGSTFGISIGMILFGVSTQLIEHGIGSSFVRILPIVGLSVSIYAANLGVFSLTFVVLAEISPHKVRSCLIELSY
jgi:MFS family permease